MRKGYSNLNVHFQKWHQSPPPFNPDVRPGFGEALSKEYTKWCDENEGSTQEDRKKAHEQIADRLRPFYPSVREMENEKGVTNECE